MDYGFSQRSSSWLIDLAEVPGLPRGLRWLCRFASQDHLGDPYASLQANLNRFLAEHGVARAVADPDAGQPAGARLRVQPAVGLLLLRPAGPAQPHRRRGAQHLRRPAQLPARTDEAGRAETDKLFYVSPFYPVDGSYTMRLPEPGAELTVTVTLHRAGERPFSAVHDRHRDSGGRSRLISALASPLATRAVMFGIKRHGIALYLKGLRPFPRTAGSENAACRQEQSSARSEAR